jgi:uncharacterized membrane protein
MARRIMCWLGIAALVIGYPLLEHYTNESAHDGNLGALVAIAPVVLIALILAWRSTRRFIMLGVLAVLYVALWVGWSALERHFGLVYWLQSVSMQLILFMTFGRTLIAGRQPLCTRLAEMVHTSLTPQHQIYARQVTVAWTLFFAAMALTSSLLFFLTPLATWSFFSNLLTLPLIVLMFIVEYGVRRWTLPDTRHAHIFDAIKVYLNRSAHPR